MKKYAHHSLTLFITAAALSVISACAAGAGNRVEDAAVEVVAPVVASAGEQGVAPEAAQEPEEPPVYDESADAAADIAAAVAVAEKENTRVLIQWGANWCGWCKLLHQLFNEDSEIRRKILYEYEVVYVDVGRFDKNVELAEKYDADFKNNGVPFITILDGDGNVVVNQETGSLEEGRAHDPVKVLDFLTAHQAEYLNAEDLLKEALAKVGEEEKRLFLTFGAPW